MTWKECPAGWVSVTLWPAYLKTGKDEKGNRPSTIAFGPELHKGMMDLIKDRQYNTKLGPGQTPDKGNTFMGMDVVCDESLGDDGWEIRWGE
jgi:hypothetical protein